jgi:hypothetical protein
MAISRPLFLALVATAFLCEPSFAQTATPPANHVPLAKAIGEPATQIVPSLIVINSRAAVLQDGKLTLSGVMPTAIVFADRPVRAAGHAPTVQLVKEWAPKQTFAQDPPNATISVFTKDGGTVRDAVVTLKSVALEGDRLTFEVDVLEGALAGGDGAAALFIDPLGFGRFQAGDFRSGYRPYVAGGAWYRGASYGAGVAGIGAAATAPASGYGDYGSCGFALIPC